LSMVL